MHLRRYLEALDFVNEERRTLGLKALERLPEGPSGAALRCTLRGALPLAVAPGEHRPAALGGRRPGRSRLALNASGFDAHAQPI